MSSNPKPSRVYTTIGPEAYRPPDYARVVRSLTEAELRDELAARRGDPGYLAAVQAEIEHRFAGGDNAKVR